MRTIYLPKQEFQDLEKISSVQSITRGNVLGTVTAEGKVYVITGSCSSGAKGYEYFNAVQVVDAREYRGSRKPVTYDQHQGTGYTGVKVKHRDRNLVLTGKQIYFKEGEPKRESYFGGKNGNGTWQTIINQIPPHESYVELFLGSGAIIRNKKPAEAWNVGVELNAGIIDKYHYKPRYKVLNICAIEWLWMHYLASGWGLNKKLFMYVDPPYPEIKGESEYKHVLSWDQHGEMLKLFGSMKCMIAISSYENDLYDKMLRGWRKFKFMSATRGGLAEETLYMNYPEPRALHEYTHLGKDFVDRQRIKRKIQRHIDRLKKLPVLERNAILGPIQSELSMNAGKPGHSGPTRRK